MGQAALKAASCKVMKHEKACLENQHVFIPFAFDTFGFLAPEAVDLLNRVQRVMHKVKGIPGYPWQPYGSATGDNRSKNNHLWIAFTMQSRRFAPLAQRIPVYTHRVTGSEGEFKG
ncbi:hypothetical protein LXL04_028133 [Taraxacum kok-saghyz]